MTKNISLDKKYFNVFLFAGKKPIVKSVDMTLVKNSDKVKMVCRIKDYSRDTEILWRKDGQHIINTEGKIKIREKR